MPKAKKDTAAAVRFANTKSPVAPSFTICNLSESDVKLLNSGMVPDWILETTEAFLAWNGGPAAGIARATSHRETAKATD